ncbi:MAG: hypothetical protein M1828_003395 [Chrysothrix sp. TS-e1954]|nr:MAG: hypothetical protein M1828_003395 [Chrysothrix sp. TS-e1954]
MAYILPIHRPSSVRHALKLDFLQPEEQCLAVAKSNRLEFYTQGQDGLILRNSKSVYGRITMLNKIRPEGSQTDQLFVGTDRYMYFTLSWDSIEKRLRTRRSFLDLADKSARDSQTGDRCHLEPDERFMTLELYEGVITLLPILKKGRKDAHNESGSLGEPIPTRISEMFVRSSVFFRTRKKGRACEPTMALLHEDTLGKVKLRIRRVAYKAPVSSADTGSVDLQDVPAVDDDLERGSSHLIPVPAPAYGVLVLAETSIMYFEPSSEQVIRQPLKDATIFIAWEQIDQQRSVLADEYGKLYLLMLDIETPDNVTGWRIDVIGETSKASVLVYLGDGNVFVGSHQGDSQVISIKPQAMEIVQMIPNIAPILDFAVMDMGNRSTEGPSNEFSSGQARLVTGSGAFKDGSLRSVRSGVGLEDLGVLGQMTNVTDMFGIKSSNASQRVDTLVVSFVDETRVFHFDADGEIEELESFCGMSLNDGSLLVANLKHDRLVQVTRSSVTVQDAGSGMISSKWAPKSNISINAVSATDDQIILLTGGATVVVLDVGNELVVSAERDFDVESETQVACITAVNDAPFCIVGFWQSSTISVLGLSDLRTLHTESISTDNLTVPRSMLVARMLPSRNPTLFIANADGNVVSYTIDLQQGSLHERKSIVLGSQQASFRALPRGDGLSNVFAICEHSSLIYGSEGRVVYSAVTASKARSICAFDCASYPGAIALATDEELKIALVDEERTTHVQCLPVGETVRRIVYSPSLKSFGLGTIKRTLENGVEVVQSHFKIADEVMFQVLASHELNEDELVESVMRAQLDNGHGDKAERFVVGTAYLDDDGAESVRGRIIVFELTQGRKLRVVTQHAVKGACRCLAMVGDKIVAALIKTVVVYAYGYQTPSSPFFDKRASYRTSTAPIDLAVSGNTIAVADLMKSVSLVEYKEGHSGRPDTLKEIARHFQTSWATSVARIDEAKYLETDAEGNLLILEQNLQGVTADDRRRLMVTSEMCLGETVNKSKPIEVQMAKDAVVTPRAFLATVEGSIHLLATINAAYQDPLIRLQSSIASYVQSPGQIPFSKFRAFRNQTREEAEPVRFVDGELIEHFLDCEEQLQTSIVKDAGLKFSVEETKEIVESLRRLR